jgi:ADP-ribose pyrophosphatase YjhB (NUDIX family)
VVPLFLLGFNSGERIIVIGNGIVFTFVTSYMKKKEEIQNFLKYGEDQFLPHLSIDCVIFGYHSNQLKILLTKWKDLKGWSLPGGYIGKTESLEESASRILKERTCLKKIHLQQFKTFGAIDRVTPQNMNTNLLGLEYQIDPSRLAWMSDRMLSIGFYSLVEYSKVAPLPDFLSDECVWWDIHEVPELFFDHNLIVDEALKTLRLHIYHQPIGIKLLPEKFTLPELQGLYETILGKKLDRRNFQKKIMSLGILIKLEEFKSIGPHRSPVLYKFDKQKYEKALKVGITFGF